MSISHDYVVVSLQMNYLLIYTNSKKKNLTELKYIFNLPRFIKNVEAMRMPN